MYSFDSKVRFSEVDHKKQITLPGIINYFQDCSTFHSESLGLGLDYFAEHKRAWVLSSWQIVVERYPSFNELVEVQTWATKFAGLYGHRNFCIRDAQRNAVAYANSVWVYMDMVKGRPVKPEPYEIDPYGSEPEFPMDYASRKIAFPKESNEGEAFTVKKYHIDTNEHVNNCQYVQMALEVLEGDRSIRQVRAEYRKSAIYKDTIVPMVAKEEEQMVVALCDTQGKPYAIVEFKENRI